MRSSQALWYAADRRIEIRPLEFPAPGPDDVLLRAVASGISRGTERLVWQGRVPESEHLRMRCPHQEGDFPFPVKYGYALVAEVEDGPDELRGQLVFALHPHQRHVRLPRADIHPVPPGIPAPRAALAANMETALNILWDAGAMAGDRILVVGGGLVGLLVTALAARLPGATVTLIDPLASREVLASRFGATFMLPQDAPRDQDVVIHASGRPEGLRLALAAAGAEARVVEASWYGDCDVAVPLGEAFHAKRLSLVSSQVGAVPAERRARWTTRRRLRTALNLLNDDQLDALIERTIPFADAPAQLPDCLNDSMGLATVLSYD